MARRFPRQGPDTGQGNRMNQRDDLLFMDRVGGKDHGTVIRALRRIEARLELIVQCEPAPDDGKE